MLGLSDADLWLEANGRIALGVHWQRICNGFQLDAVQGAGGLRVWSRDHEFLGAFRYIGIVRGELIFNREPDGNEGQGYLDARIETARNGFDHVRGLL